MGKTLQKGPVVTLKNIGNILENSVPNVHCIQNKVYYFFSLLYNLPPKIVPVLDVFLSTPQHIPYIFFSQNKYTGSLHGKQVVCMTLILERITTTKKVM